MNFSKLILINILSLSLAFSSFAGPTTNLEEYKGDQKLTKAQEQAYQQHLDNGAKYFESGKYDEAEKEYKAILAFAPSKNLAYFNLGLVKYKQGDYKAAIGYFDTVIKKRSYYVGAAFYYKAIAQLNLDQTEDAVKTARRFTPARFFYGPSQSLIKSIQTGRDEYLDNANAALADENYELCMLEVGESVFADTQKGKELYKKCQEGFAKEETISQTIVNTKKIPNRYRLWFNSRYRSTDNVYQENTNTVSASLYNINLGGEYIVASKVDYGIGFSYDLYDAANVKNFRDEVMTVYAPFYYRVNKHRYSAELFYNHSLYNSVAAWSEYGAYFNYFYSEEKYVVGLVTSAAQRNSLVTNQNYRSGPFTSIRLVGTRYLGSYTLNGYLGVDEYRAGNQPIATSFMPFGNKSTRAGASLAYDFDQRNRLTARTNLTKRDYLDVVSANGTDRADTTTTIGLAYQHRFNKFLRAYVEQSQTKNDSNYDSNEIIDKNYTENVTTLGVGLSVF